MPPLTGSDGTPSGFSANAPFGVWGDSGSAGPFGRGGNGVVGSSALSSGIAGFTLADSNVAAGVYGAGPQVGIAGGVTGSNTAPAGKTGVYGTGSNRLNLGGIGVVGESDTSIGVAGHSTSATGVSGSSQSGPGVSGFSESAPGVVGVSAEDTGVIGVSNGIGVLGLGGDDSGFFFGNVRVIGSITKGGGGFAIDHPLNPANQYLRHSFVESPEMKNIYDGVAVCDPNGEIVVHLPEWFEALNGDFRYQLTPIGTPAPNLFIAAEIRQNRFRIAGGSSGQKVSWQVTAVRHDAWARANPVVVEEDKSASDRGRFLHPQAHGHPADRTVAHAHYIKAQRHLTRS